MTTATALLIVGIVLLNAYDVFSTFQCFKLGGIAAEGNPITKWFIQKCGFWGSVFIFKMPLIIACIIVLYMTDLLWALSIMYCLIAIYNTYVWTKWIHSKKES